MLSKYTSFVGLAFLLSACGGGSTSDSGNNEVVLTTEQKAEKIKQYSEIISNPIQYSDQELREAAKGLAVLRYEGVNHSADLDKELVSSALLHSFSFVEMRFISSSRVSQQLHSFKSINDDFECKVSGNVTIETLYEGENSGRVGYKFDKCVERNGVEISGVLALSISQNESGQQHSEIYYDNLSIGSESLSGYSSRKNFGSETVLAIGTNGVSSAKIDIKRSVAMKDEARREFVQNYNGRISFSNLGTVDVEAIDLVNLDRRNISGSLAFIGKQKVKFEYSDSYIKYLVDKNNDGAFDVGTYVTNFSDSNTFSANAIPMVNTTRLHPVQNLSLPPSVETPMFVFSWSNDATTFISLYPAEYTDPDTPDSDLKVRYKWYVSGRLIHESETPTLLPYTAKPGDYLSVVVAVSDETSTIHSERAYLQLDR